MLQIGSRGIEVTKLQGDLNRLLPGEMPQLKPDGVFGPKTRDRVLKFQSRNGLRPDGVAGPKTRGRMQQLSGPGPKPPVPGVPAMPPPPPAVGINRFAAEMQKVFEQKGKQNQFGDFLNDLESNHIPGWKNFLGTIGRAEDARTVAAFWIELFEITQGARSQMPTVFAAVVKLDKDTLVLFEALSAPTSKFGKFLKGAGNVASAVGLLVTVVECVQHARRGDAGAVAAELYKFGMGKGVPWAAMIEGVGSLLDGVVPEQTRKNSMLFKIMRSIDPIGMGAVGVDSVVSIVTGGLEMAARGRVDVDILTNRLTPLVARMKQGPARLFVELGENSGDALYELCQTGVDWQAIMRYTHMELMEWFESVGSGPRVPMMGGIRRGTI
jgi:peptidoglycan hydrolase-like protein with peptidoglycan-binding domain